MTLIVNYLPVKGKVTLATKLDFGKYKGFTIKEILEYDWKYIKTTHNRVAWFEVNNSIRDIINEKN